MGLQGRPIYIQLLGKIDISTLKQITSEERMIKFHIQEYERCGKIIMPICSSLRGRQIDQTFGIMDVKGTAGDAITQQHRPAMQRQSLEKQMSSMTACGAMCVR